MIDRPAFPRRLFLKRSLQTTALVALPWSGSGCAPERDPESGLITFSSSEYAVADAFARTLIPDGGAFEAGAGSVGLAARMDAYLWSERPEVLNGFGSALWLLNLGPLFVIGKPRRFTKLDLADRETYLEALPTSFGLAREIYHALRRSFMFLFYNIDETWEPLGYDGPWAVAQDDVNDR